MTFALQTTSNHWAGVPILCPRISSSGDFALGALAIAAAFSALYIAVQSPVYVQLFVATAAGMLGMLAVRNRPPSEVGIDDLPVTHRKPFQSDANRLALVGNAMMQETCKKSQPLSIVVFEFTDLPELQDVYEGKVPRDLGPTIEKKLRSGALAKGAVVRTGPTTFAVLLPNFDARSALRAMHEAFGKACCLEFELGDNELLLVPHYHVKTIRRGTEPVQDVYQALHGDLLKAQLRAERRQAYLRRERESHTRPMMPSSN